MQPFDPHSRSHRDSRDLTLAVFLTRVAGFLRGLRGIDPIFSDLYIEGGSPNQEIRLDDDLGNFEELGLALAWNPTAPASSFTCLDECGCPTPASRSADGWSLSLTTKSTGDMTVMIFIEDGIPPGQEPSNCARLWTSLPFEPEVSERLFKYLVEFWNPAYAFATSTFASDAQWSNPTAPDGQLWFVATDGMYSREELGSLNYRADPDFARFLPDTVRREPLGTGVLFRLGDGRVLTEEDTAEVLSALMLQAALHNDVPASPLYAEASWGPRDIALGDFLSLVEEFLRGLREIHPPFWFMLFGKRVEETDLPPLDDDLRNFAEIGFACAWDVYEPQRWYTDLDKDGHPTLASHSPVTGWTLDIFSSMKRDQLTLSALISIREGCQSKQLSTNRVRMSMHRVSPLLGPDISEQLFKYLVEFWKPEEASFTGIRFREATENTLTQEDFGWLNYRADPGYARYLPDSVHREPLGQGVFFRIGDGRVLTEQDTAEVRTALAIQAAVQNDVPPPE